MPGFIVHLAIAKRFIENYSEYVKDKQEFIQGTIDVDRFKIEREMNTHCNPEGYNPSKNGTPDFMLYINSFIRDKNNLSDYDKGVLLHLLTDKIFYRLYEWNQEFYNDYNLLDPIIMKKYNLDFEQLLEQMNTKDSKNAVESVQQEIQKHHENANKDWKLKYLTEDGITDFIEKASKINLDDFIEKIMNQYTKNKGDLPYGDR